MAEQVVRKAIERGIPCAIYRPATISGDSKNGASNWEASLNRFLCSIPYMKTYPLLTPNERCEIEMIPVDFVAKSIVAISLQTNCYGKTYNVVNPTTHSSISPCKSFVFNPLSNVILYRDVNYNINQGNNSRYNFNDLILRHLQDANRTIELNEGSGAVKFHANLILKVKDAIEVFKKRGYQLKGVDINEWVKQISEDQNNPLFPLIGNFSAPYHSFSVKPSHHSNLLNGINSFPIQCPPQDKSLLDKYISFYIKEGLIPPP